MSRHFILGKSQKKNIKPDAKDSIAKVFSLLGTILKASLV